MTAQDMTFVHISDTHILQEGKFYWDVQDGYTSTMRVFYQMREYGLQPDFIVISGDLVQGREYDDYAAYARFNEVMDHFRVEFGVPILLALGNGDTTEVFRKVVLGETDPDPYQRYYYSRVINGLKIIVLDTHDPRLHWGEIDAEQLAWLRNELEQEPNRDYLLVLHHTPATVVLDRDFYELRNRDKLEAIIKDYNFLGVLGGHVHMRFFTHFAGFPCIVATGICNSAVWSPARQQMNLLDSPGYNLVHIRDRKLMVQWIDMPGERRNIKWVDGGFVNWTDQEGD